MKIEEVSTLLTPERLPYLNGVERLTDGVLHVAVLTRMPEASPEMVGWWFGEYLQTTEHYKRWHPRDHLWMKWEDKKPGTHLGAKHLVHQYIRGRLHKLRITFVSPQEFFPNALEGASDALAVCGRTGLLDRPIDVGHMVHVALPRPWGCELHSRFWLAHAGGRREHSLSSPPVRISFVWPGSRSALPRRDEHARRVLTELVRARSVSTTTTAPKSRARHQGGRRLRVLVEYAAAASPARASPGVLSFSCRHQPQRPPSPLRGFRLRHHRR